jgi:hypothetical protein
MPANTSRLRDNITALAALRFDHAQIVDGRVTNPDAAALILQAVQAHICALVACLPRTPATRIRAAGVVDRGAMTDAELFAYYKRTAPAEDLRFFLRARMSDALRRRAEAVTKPTAADLTNLRAAWRTERAIEERNAGIPAIGTAEWHQQFAHTRDDIDLPEPDADPHVATDAPAVADGVSS